MVFNISAKYEACLLNWRNAGTTLNIFYYHIGYLISAHFFRKETEKCGTMPALIDDAVLAKCGTMRGKPALGKKRSNNSLFQPQNNTSNFANSGAITEQTIGDYSVNRLNIYLPTK